MTQTYTLVIDAAAMTRITIVGDHPARRGRGRREGTQGDVTTELEVLGLADQRPHSPAAASLTTRFHAVERCCLSEGSRLGERRGRMAVAATEALMNSSVSQAPHGGVGRLFARTRPPAGRLA